MNEAINTLDYFDKSTDKSQQLNVATKIGNMIIQKTKIEEASLLNNDYFNGRLQASLAEEDRFVELFGYYPGGLGL